MGSTSKSDMDRIGLFQEMEYVTIKDPFKEAARCKLTAPCLQDFSSDGHQCCFFLFAFIKLISMKQRTKASR